MASAELDVFAGELVPAGVAEGKPLTHEPYIGVPCPRLGVGMLRFAKFMATQSSGHGTQRLFCGTVFNRTREEVSGRTKLSF